MKFTIAMIAMLSYAEAIMIRQGHGNGHANGMAEGSVGEIEDNSPHNDDFHCVVDDGQEQYGFMEWVSIYGSNYSTEEEMQEGYNNYVAHNKTIREHNQQAMNSGEANPAMMNHNALSGLSDEQIAKMLGHVSTEGQGSNSNGNSLAQVKGDLVAGTVDHSQATKPVYDQGVCGSCWAFAGNTVLEATDFIINGGDRKSLSHQHPVSCAPTSFSLFGCYGGDSERMW